MPQSKFNALESQSRIITEQNKAQIAEIENLKVHARTVEDQLIAAEQQLAKADPQKAGGVITQVAGKATAAPRRQFAGVSPPVSDEVKGQLAALARRYPNLQYDPATSVCKLDSDVLFTSGDTQIKPEAERVLRDFARLMQAPDNKDLKVMLVGHTDDAGIKGRELRSKYANNWMLSSARAVAVADRLEEAGIARDRMGVSGHADHQPISPNDTAESRMRNRRVEIFVVSPETPVVGWTETHSGVYR